jgi:Short C-terminal domain
MMRRGMRRGRPGLVGTMARTAVVAGTATAVAGGVRNHQAGKAEQAQEAQAYEQQQAAAAAAPAPAPVAAPAGDDMITQLKELAQLKDQGILTEEEFAAQKAKILG